MADRRRRGIQWYVADDAGELYPDMRDGVTAALLMDIRDELQTLNRLLACPNFTQIPTTLRAIRKNTTKARRKKT